MKYTPLRLAPHYQEYLWGGKRLKRDYGKWDAPEVTAESWELSAHPDGPSLVAAGPLAGKTILELGQMDRVGFWGRTGEEFPILVKLIDAERDLSVQVHPSDANALRWAGEHGKAELWYVVDCKPQSCLYYGFSTRITRDELLERARDGNICQVLNRVPVARGDVFYILPGTIHAIGAGILIAEIQQNSNTTFRVYDYQRRDGAGRLRPLHLERAAQVVDYAPVVPAECKVNSGAEFPEFSMAEMFSCRYFQAFRLDVRTGARLACDGTSFQHLLCVEGGGEILCGGERYPLRRGDSYFMPAKLGEYQLLGGCRVLLSRIGKEGLQ